MVSAQVGDSLRGQAGSSTPERTARRAAEIGRQDSQIYDQLAKEYELFGRVNRMSSWSTRPSRRRSCRRGPKTARRRSQRIKKFDGTRSAVIVRNGKNPGLYILTNHHVVEGGKIANIRIFLHDGRALTPERIWSDAEADIAVLKLDRDDLPAARLGNSDTAVVGSWVVAVGSPFGLMHSVSRESSGPEPAHGRARGRLKNQDFLQTDAAINPGNSGGPLVNLKGKVMGINNSIASDGGGIEGVGFSIPINLARWIINELISNGHVTRGAGGYLHPKFRREMRRLWGSTGRRVPGSARCIPSLPLRMADCRTAT